METNAAIKHLPASKDAVFSVDAVLEVLRGFFPEERLDAVVDSDLLAFVSDASKVSRFIGHLQARLAGEIQKRSVNPNSSLYDRVKANGRNPNKAGSDILQKITGDPFKKVAKTIEIGKSITAEVSWAGEPAIPEYPAVAAGLAAGVINLDTADVIMDVFNRLKKDLQNAAGSITADLLAAEFTLVAQAAGAGVDAETLEAIKSGNTELYADAKTLENILTNKVASPINSDHTRVNARVIAEQLKANILTKAEFDVLEQTKYRKRFLTLNEEPDGLVRVNGLLMPEVAAGLSNLLFAINSPKTETNKHDPTAPDQQADSRDYGEKRHDALAIIVNIAAKNAETPNLAGGHATVLVEVTAETLNNVDSDGKPKPGVGLLHGFNGEVTPIPLATVTHLGCTGTVQQVVRDKKGAIVALGTAQRAFNHNQRKAIMLRDRGCVIPDCTTPAIWCEIHHVKEFSRNGPTHTDNGVLLCWHHHRNLETDGWEIIMRKGAVWLKLPKWLNPDQPLMKHQRQAETKT